MALETGPVFPAHAASLSYARDCDAHNALRHLRDEYIQLPTRCARRVVSDVSGGDVPADAPDTASGQRSDDTTATSIYMCAHGLGLQPRAAQRYVLANLEAWATLGVDGHFQRLASAPCGVPWRDLAASCARQMNALVGADPAAVADEVVIMNGLTVNLQLMLASFYRPTATRNKILVEWRPFSSDSVGFSFVLSAPFLSSFIISMNTNSPSSTPSIRIFAGTVSIRLRLSKSPPTTPIATASLPPVFSLLSTTMQTMPHFSYCLASTFSVASSSTYPPSHAMPARPASS